MANLTTNADGSINIADTMNSMNSDSGLLSAVLGKEVASNQTSNQNTSGATTNNTVGTTAQNGTQTGATTQNTTGNTAQTGATTQATAGNTATTGTTSQNQTGQQSTAGSQQVTGNTTVNGTQATTGTINTNNTNTQQGTVTQASTADTSALQQVYAKQAAGITPDMLNAIFQQGSKAAPNLALATAGALGARGVGNSPLAQTLAAMQADLTSKAADVNRQMLADSGNTAAQIAAATKGSTTTTDMTTQSLSSQVQDLLTSTNSTTAVNQLMDSLNQTASSGTTTGTNTGNTATTGTSTGTSSQDTSTTGNTAGTSQQSTAQTGATTQSAAGTATQAVNASAQSVQQQTINKSVATGLVGLAAAGIGINELFKAATGKGFVGTIQQLYSTLKGAGVGNINTDGIDFSGVASGNFSNLFSGNLGDSVLTGGGLDIGIGGNLSDIGSVVAPSLSTNVPGFSQDFLSGLFGG